MTGMGYNHDEPITTEQATLISLLNRQGFWPPSFSTKAEKLAWLEMNRWRVERGSSPPGDSAA